METKGTICQSCGMPLQKDEDFGMNEDGSKNGEYCHFCFKDGEFTDPDITMEQKIEKIVKIAVSRTNMSEARAREMANNIIPELKRWRK
ncbi:MAG: zinc ribbon domain-containing protein [candidate division WOR-3 bacterium]|nr:MAG: zinc ribbon domain-containing protein [candidate division WOR-3 bacterium]